MSDQTYEQLVTRAEEAAARAKASANQTIENREIMEELAKNIQDALDGELQATTLPDPIIDADFESGIITSEYTVEPGTVLMSTTKSSSLDIRENIDASIIKNGETIFGVTGTYEGRYTDAIFKDWASQTEFTPGSSDVTIITAPDTWYFSSNIVMKGDPNLISSNIRSGVSIFGVAGTCLDINDAQFPVVTPSVTNNVVDIYGGSGVGGPVIVETRYVTVGNAIEGNTITLNATNTSYVVPAGSYLKGNLIISADAILVPTKEAWGVLIVYECWEDGSDQNSGVVYYDTMTNFNTSDTYSAYRPFGEIKVDYNAALGHRSSLLQQAGNATDRYGAEYWFEAYGKPEWF